MFRSSGLIERPRNFDFRFIIILKKEILVALPAMELNLEKCNSGGLHKNHAVATWNLGTISAFA
jgi:hypothetical protein